MDKLWCEPGQGFSDDWLGFRRSVDKRQSGRFYAQCKYCATVMDGRLPNLRKHKLSCPEFGSGVETEAYYPEDEVMDHSYEEQSATEEIVVKSEPKAKRRRPGLVFKTPEAAHSHVIPSPYTISTPNIAPVRHHSPPPSSSLIGRSRFADTARVWERKLCDLPLPQALQIEKNVNDMLYEATLASIQYQTPAINVNITTNSSMEQAATE